MKKIRFPVIGLSAGFEGEIIEWNQ